MNNTKSNILFNMTALAEASYTRFRGLAVGETTTAKGALRASLQSKKLKGYFKESQANDFFKQSNGPGVKLFCAVPT